MNNNHHTKQPLSPALGQLLLYIDYLHREAVSYANSPNPSNKALRAKQAQLEQLTAIYNAAEAEITHLQELNHHLANELTAATRLHYVTKPLHNLNPRQGDYLENLEALIKRGRETSNPNEIELAREATKTRARYIWPELYA